MVDIDETDRRILAVLQRDASLGLDALGERVGLSRNAVWRRVRALEAAGVIRGRVALVDAAALGLSLSVVIQVRTDRHDPEWMTAFARAVGARPEITAAYRMTGELDYLLHARVTDMKAYDRLYQALVRAVPLADVSASFVMEEVKTTTALPV